MPTQAHHQTVETLWAALSARDRETLKPRTFLARMSQPKIRARESVGI